jgi:hypothetical protein
MAVAEQFLEDQDRRGAMEAVPEAQQHRDA